MGTQSAPANLLEVLGRVPLFSTLPRSDLEKLAPLVKERRVGAGEFVFREGDRGERLYLVAEGTVEILRERPLGDHERLVVKRAGESLGEKSLLYDAPRSVSVRAVEDSLLLTIAREDFEGLVGGDSMELRIIRGLARTVRGVDPRVSREDTVESDAFRQFGRMVLQGLEPSDTPQCDGFRIAAATAREPHAGGGCLWDALVTDDRRAVLALTDVKGTGLPPAYLLAITRALFHEIAPRTSFDRLLRRLNAAIFTNLFEGLDECVETALIQVANGQIHWSCAGDQPGFILHPDGSTTEAPTHGPPLGILPQFDYGVRTLELAPGDSFVAFTGAPPGVIRGAIEAVRERTSAEPSELARLLRAAVQKVQGRGAQTDVAFVLVRKL